MVVLSALLSCHRQKTLEGQWIFAYALPTIENSNGIKMDDESDIETIGISMLMLNISLSDFEYYFDKGIVYMRKIGEESDNAVGFYDKDEKICLIKDDENYDWSFRYQIVRDSLFLINNDYKIVFARNSI